KLLRENNIAVKEVGEYTGFPEMLDGRVKTLHPKIHGGLLALRDNAEHMHTLEAQVIGLIDMVVVNLYPFEKTTQKPGVAIEEVIENIDIGGPSMLRSAAKNHRSVAVVSNPERYAQVIEELRKNKGALPDTLMRDLGIEAFHRTSSYDAAIFDYLNKWNKGMIPERRGGLNLPYVQSDDAGFPNTLNFTFEKIQDLRYGENPHQKAAFYREKGKTAGLINLKQLQGKELSFNNILDLNSAFELCREFAGPAAVIVKHNNPCGCAEDKLLERAFLAAWKCDQLSAFGGIVALNRKMDLKTARAAAKSGFLECIIAPGFEPRALELFREKKNLRLLEYNDLSPINEPDLKRVSGGLLLQDKDLATLDPDNLKVVTRRKPAKNEMESLIFGWKVAKHVKSNAIILTKGTRTVGIGAGQMSRVDSVMIARKKSGGAGVNSCLASDAFFPKPDAILWAHKAGARAIIQPGGSIADAEIIKACDKYKIAMVFTGIRHFRH
ncbi:MAG: bifunctional phosphoribosylaminoimidazolecarboxamide formyltransferase/IMP cyclohydrolase, partial [Candidatus Omnitrophota bacterium]